MQIVIRKEQCSGCRLCQQICAITHFQEVNPKKSAIRIEAEFPAPGVFTPVVCDQCGECAAVCPAGAIDWTGGRYVIDGDACTLCEECIDACPSAAIHIPRGAELPVKCDLCMKCAAVCNTGALLARADHSLEKELTRCTDSAARPFA